MAGARVDRLIWFPVFLGCGVAAYFALPWEPPLALGAGGLAVATVLAWVVRRRPDLLVPAMGVVALALGFAVSQARTMIVAAPVVQERLGPTTVVGRITLLETFPNGQRVTLERPRVIGLGPASTPEKVRLRLRGAQPEMAPGDWARFRAVLTPPPAPSAPGAFDFQRQAYFDGLGGVGFAFGPARVIDKDPGQGLDATDLTRLRHEIAARVRDQMDGPPGAVAAALMTGERRAIPDRVMDTIRASGLAHLLAISGLHIGLVAGIVLFAVRAGLALVPAVALRYPIKKWAAGAAVLGAFTYAVLAGATVPSLRAFLMIAIVLLGVIADRRGISMRMVAWAATAILIFQPEALLGASFQLSFAAVVALVATYESRAVRNVFRRSDSHGPGRRALLYLGGVALSTLIAGAATAPFAAYHFNQVADYSLAANLVAVPITGLWIMPWAVVSFALMPFGAEALGLAPMGWGVEMVLAVAERVASWPGSVSLAPAMPMWGLVLMTLGGLWLCLWRGPWRASGLAGAAAGLMAFAAHDPPDVLIDGQGKLMAARTAAGELAMSSLRTASFARETWLRRDGLPDAPPKFPKQGVSGDGRLSCDALGCLYKVGGYTVALAKRAEALEEDCRLADVVVSQEPVRRACPSARVVVDRFDVWRNGAHALWLGPEGVRVESVNRARGDRPWVVRPGKSRKGGA